MSNPTSTYQGERPTIGSKPNALHMVAPINCLEEAPIPPFGEAQVVVHVMAAAVSGLGWKIRASKIVVDFTCSFIASAAFPKSAINVYCVSAARSSLVARQ